MRPNAFERMLDNTGLPARTGAAADSKNTFVSVQPKIVFILSKGNKFCKFVSSD